MSTVDYCPDFIDSRGPIVPFDLLKKFNIPLGAKNVFGFIVSYAQNGKSCWAKPKWFADKMGVSENSARSYLHTLLSTGIIWRDDKGIYHIRWDTFANDDPATPVLQSDENPTPQAADSCPDEPTNSCETERKICGEKRKICGVYNNLNTKIKKPSSTPPQPLAFAPAARVVSSSPPKEISRVAGASPIRPSRQDQSQAEEAFAQVWAAYPRPPRFVSRDKAWQVWWKLWRQGALPELESVLSAIKLNAKHNPAWNPGNENSRYIPNLENWLAGKRWQDDIPCPSQALSTPSVHSRHMIQQAQSVLRSLHDLKSNPAPAPSPDVADFERLAAQFGGIDEKKRPMAMGLFRLVKAKGLQVQPQAGDFITVLKHAVAGVL